MRIYFKSSDLVWAGVGTCGQTYPFHVLPHSSVLKITAKLSFLKSRLSPSLDTKPGTAVLGRESLVPWRFPYMFINMFSWLSRADLSIYLSPYSCLSDIHSMGHWWLILNKGELKSSLLFLGNRDIGYSYGQTHNWSPLKQEDWFLWFLFIFQSPWISITYDSSPWLICFMKKMEEAEDLEWS